MTRHRVAGRGDRRASAFRTVLRTGGAAIGKGFGVGGASNGAGAHCRLTTCHEFFRSLPVQHRSFLEGQSVDNFCWRWPRLGAIVGSRSPRESLRVERRRVEAGLTEISLVNEGELDISSRLAVEVRWTDARLIASDALRDFELADRSASAARFQTQLQPCRLCAGDLLTPGWLRFDRDCEVRCELETL